MLDEKDKSNFEYLSNFDRVEMETLLKLYEYYLKLNNMVRLSGFFILITIGIFRFIDRSVPRDSLLVLTLIVIVALLIWLFVIVRNLIKQKNKIKNQLDNMAMSHNYEFKLVKKEFNTMVKSLYKGSKI